MNRVAVPAGVVGKRAAVPRMFTRPDERQADADGIEGSLAEAGGFSPWDDRAAQKDAVEPCQTADPTPRADTATAGNRQKMLWRIPINTLWRGEEPSPDVRCYSTARHVLADKKARDKRWDSYGGS
jgi:hypothetical protein